MLDRTILASALVLALTTGAASAASFANSDGFFNITLKSASGDLANLFIDTDAGDYTETDADGDGVPSAAATASANAEGGALAAGTSAIAPGSTLGFAFGFASADGYWFFENLSASADSVIDLEFDYEWGVSAAVGGDGSVGDDAYADIVLDVTLDGDELLFASIFLDLFNGASAESLGDSGVLSVSLGSGEFAALETFIDSESYASAVTAIPVPAAGPLLLLGVAGLAALRRRRAA